MDNWKNSTEKRQKWQKKCVKVVKYVLIIAPIKKWMSPACRARKNV
jgi:hypothetical protein